MAAIGHNRKFGVYFNCFGEPLDGCEQGVQTDLYV